MITNILSDTTTTMPEKVALTYLFVEQSAPANLKKWALELRMSDRHLHKAVAALLNKNLGVIKTKSSKTYSSKTMGKYELKIQKLDEYFQNAESEIHIPEPPHLELLEFIMRHTFTSREQTSGCKDKTIQQSFLPKHSLLLSMFLLYADEYGVVDNLSKNKLRKFTGYTQSQLNYQVDLLIKSGLIMTRSSGSSKTKLVGRTKSIYLVRLEHEFFGKKKYCTKPLMQKSMIFGFCQRSFIKEGLENSVRDISRISTELTRKQAQFMYRKIVELFFDLRMNLAESLFFQVQCERTLSMLFTYHLRHLRSESSDTSCGLEVVDCISEQIKQYEEQYFRGTYKVLEAKWPQVLKSSIFCEHYEETLLKELDALDVVMTGNLTDLIGKFLIFLIHDIILIYIKTLLNSGLLNSNLQNHRNTVHEFIRFRPGKIDGVDNVSDKDRIKRKIGGNSHIIEHVWRAQLES